MSISIADTFQLGIAPNVMNLWMGNNVCNTSYVCTHLFEKGTFKMFRASLHPFRLPTQFPT